MRPHQFSQTAIGAALIRSLHLAFGDPVVFADPFADQLVPAADRDRILTHMLELLSPADRGAALAMEGDRKRAAFLLRALPFTATSLANHRYAEDRLAEALERGVSQYVVLGAGLDSYALRAGESGRKVRVYEVDHPATQGLKTERLRRLGLEASGDVRFVPLDFEREDLRANLLAAGFDSGRPAFVSWLNVTAFLTREAISGTLESIGALSAAGSGLVFDFYGEEVRRQDEEVARLFRTAESIGEPMTEGMPLDWLEGRLRQTGYGGIVLVRPEDLEDLRPAMARNGYSYMPGCYLASAVKR